MAKKNETTKLVEAGTMALACKRCGGTIFFPVSLDLFSQIKVFGLSVFSVPCPSCHDSLRLTLEG